MLISFLLKGMLVGIVIAVPVGPVGILCIRRTILDGRLPGLFSGLGAASADSFFGIIAGFGLTFISDSLFYYQDWLRVGAAGFLLYVGITALMTDPTARVRSGTDPEGLFGDFASTFALTITNPVTILSFLAIFGAIGFTGEEATLLHATILVAGVWVGSFLWWIGLVAGAGLLRMTFQRQHLVWINRGSGGVLVFAGVALIGSLVIEHWWWIDSMVYLPPHFTETREEVLLAHIERHDFALLITKRDELIASQVPILAERREGQLYLQAHLARGNPQCLDVYAGGEMLAIFTGPHAYISPSWYGAAPAVPTWNYASVHAYGTPRAIDDKEWMSGFLRRLSERHEAREAAPWRMQDQPEAFLDGMMNGILGFEIAVTRLEGKFKLSQNRPSDDRPRIIAKLEARGDSDALGIAGLMKERLTP